MTTRRFFATLGVAATIAATGSLLPSATPDAKAYQYNWGAISWGWQGNTGYAVDYPNQASAIRAAKGTCGSCGYFTFYNSCGAIAYRFGARTVIGRASGYPSRAAAENAARAKAGPGSHIRAYACTTR